MKLAGRTDLEDSLKRLDKLTQEEARMATAQLLKVTHIIDEGVRGVADKIIGVDDRVASVNERVVTVDSKVEAVDLRVVGVDERVAGVDERVRTVDDKVALVIEGVRFIFSRSADTVIYNLSTRWKGGSGRHETSSERRRSNQTSVNSWLHRY
jgi:uncharacterized protein YfcZ (UPF0381/DUF406 family)